MTDWTERKQFLNSDGEIELLNFEELYASSLRIVNKIFDKKFCFRQDEKLDVCQECAFICMKIYADYELEKGLSVYSMLFVECRNKVYDCLFPHRYLNIVELSLDSDRSLNNDGKPISLANFIPHYDEYDLLILPPNLTAIERQFIDLVIADYNKVEIQKIIGKNSQSITLQLRKKLKALKPLEPSKPLTAYEELLYKRRKALEWYARNREKVIAYVQKYRLNNPNSKEKDRAYSKSRYDKLKTEYLKNTLSAGNSAKETI